MGWTDGISTFVLPSCSFLNAQSTNPPPNLFRASEQNIHFIAAIVGLGILAIYGIWHSCLSIALLAGNLHKTSEGRPPSLVLKIARTFFCIWHLVCSVGSPTFVVMWIVKHASPFEWTAVGLLFVYFVPYIFEFLLQEYSTSSSYLALSMTLE
jgi:hypothetical protein